MSILTSWLTLILLCNQYYSTVVHLLIIYIAIFVMEHHWKNLLATWGLEPASPVSVVNRHALSSRPSCIPKKGCIKPSSWHWTNGKRQCCLTLGLMHPFLGMHDGLEDKACLLTTDTGDAGSSPHVARRFFQWCSMTNIAIYIINKWTTVL